jgi:O-acetyl-ADP-ribose deacetylase (regulator of RNase III)
MTQVHVHKGDITLLPVDAIVNAANSSLLGGGGVDGAIHRAAGKELLEACRQLNGCRPGEAKITMGYNLPAKHVIHTVGPIWNGGNNREQEILAACYTNSLTVASTHGLRTIAFPCISTGVYRFPIALAATIAVATARQYITNNPTTFDRISFVCFDDVNYNLYLNELGQ